MSTPTATDIRVASEHKALAEMVKTLFAATEDSANPENGNDAFVMDLMEQILNADSFDDIFEAQESGMTSGKDFADIPFYIERSADVQWRRTSQGYMDQGAFPFFAILKVTTLGDRPQTLTLNCGGNTFVAVLYKLWSKGYFDRDEPMPLQIRSTPTTDGKSYLQLVPYRVVAPPTSKKK